MVCQRPAPRKDIGKRRRDWLRWDSEGKSIDVDCLTQFKRSLSKPVAKSCVIAGGKCRRM